MSKLTDFYYSEAVERRIKENDKYHVVNKVFINGKWYVYTECVSHGKKTYIESNDNIFLGTSEGYENIKSGDQGAVRKVKRYYDKDCKYGVCQLCFSDSCYNERIEEI